MKVYACGRAHHLYVLLFRWNFDCHSFGKTVSFEFKLEQNTKLKNHWNQIWLCAKIQTLFKRDSWLTQMFVLMSSSQSWFNSVFIRFVIVCLIIGRMGRLFRNDDGYRGNWFGNSADMISASNHSQKIQCDKIVYVKKNGGNFKLNFHKEKFSSWFLFLFKKKKFSRSFVRHASKIYYTQF